MLIHYSRRFLSLNNIFSAGSGMFASATRMLRGPCLPSSDFEIIMQEKVSQDDLALSVCVEVSWASESPMSEHQAFPDWL